MSSALTLPPFSVVCSCWVWDQYSCCTFVPISVVILRESGLLHFQYFRYLLQTEIITAVTGTYFVLLVFSCIPKRVWSQLRNCKASNVYTAKTCQHLGWIFNMFETSMSAIPRGHCIYSTCMLLEILLSPLSSTTGWYSRLHISIELYICNLCDGNMVIDNKTKTLPAKGLGKIKFMPLEPARGISCCQCTVTMETWTDSNCQVWSEDQFQHIS